jgi:hypothetical protein
MRLFPALVFLILPITMLAQENAAFSHGTLITAMGNQNGIVLVTDSMLSHVDAEGKSRPDPSQPLQKLIPYGDRMICATAGTLVFTPSKLGKPTDQLLKKLDFQVLGLIQFYRDAIKKQGRIQSMADTLAGLSAVIRYDFAINAEILNSMVGIINDYHLELFLAGIDVDGLPKIGRLDISVKREEGRMVAEEIENNCKLHTVGKELTVCPGGVEGIERKMLANPQAYHDFPIMATFAKAMVKDHGASLTVDEMKTLAHAFKAKTERSYNGVGGADQVASITKLNMSVTGLDHFEPIPSPSPVVILSCRPGYGFHKSSPLAPQPVPLLYEHCVFNKEEERLDGNVYLKCVFRDSFLLYNGGDTIFGPDNIIEGNSTLELGRESCLRPDIVDQLVRRFDFIHGGALGPGTNDFLGSPCSNRNSEAH